MLKPCDCKHDFQQSQYGNLRVHVPKGPAKQPGQKGWECTVCKKLKS